MPRSRVAKIMNIVGEHFVMLLTLYPILDSLETRDV